MFFVCLVGFVFVAVLAIHFKLIRFSQYWNFQLEANAILAVSVSLAVCNAGAAVKKIPLYKVRFFSSNSSYLWILCSHVLLLYYFNFSAHCLAGNKTLVLPMLSFNVINGGSHARNKLAMQLMSCLQFY